MKTRNIVVVALTIVIATIFNPCTYPSQITKEPALLPIIDMHCHAIEGSEEKDFYGNPASANSEMLFLETYQQFRKWNVIKAVVSGPLDCVEMWESNDTDNRVIRGIMMMAPTDDQMNPTRFESLIREGKIKVFGEIVPMVKGMTINDPEWQPYLAICEKYEVPLMLHTGNIPKALVPWATKLRQHLGDPYLIEDVLVRYPKLRIYLCHFGTEWREHTLALMIGYPQLYTDIGAMLWLSPLHKKMAKEFLTDAKLAGCLDRVMFGSDQMNWPHAIEMSIEYLNSLDFLTEKDKRDILYNNAAKFLRLKE